MWSKPANALRTLKLWQAVAKRYKGKKAIAAFDLLNEPMGAADAKSMLTFQFQLFRAIRDIDPTRLVIVEDGYKGLEQFIPVAGAQQGRRRQGPGGADLQRSCLPDAHREAADAGAPRKVLRRADPEDAEGGRPASANHSTSANGTWSRRTPAGRR